MHYRTPGGYLENSSEFYQKSNAKARKDTLSGRIKKENPGLNTDGNIGRASKERTIAELDQNMCKNVPEDKKKELACKIASNDPKLNAEARYEIKKIHYLHLLENEKIFGTDFETMSPEEIVNSIDREHAARLQDGTQFYDSTLSPESADHLDNSVMSLDEEFGKGSDQQYKAMAEYYAAIGGGYFCPVGDSAFKKYLRKDELEYFDEEGNKEDLSNWHKIVKEKRAIFEAIAEEKKKTKKEK